MIKVWRLEMETQALPHTRDPEFATATARGISRGAEKNSHGKKERTVKESESKSIVAIRHMHPPTPFYMKSLW